ncbi:MAG: glycosyltransferase [Nocardioides sp.]
MTQISNRPRPRANGTRELRVASVPASHVYVQHLAPEHGGRVRRMPDPVPLQPDRSTRQPGWSPVMLDPTWIARHAFDLFHLQFGFDGSCPEELAAVVRSVQDTGRPFVFTVHDLRHPHHRDRALRDSQLDALVPAADAVVTLTEGAAVEIERRWNRQAVVVPHPHVVPFRTIECLQRRPRDMSGSFRVGLHVKSLQGSAQPLQLLPTLERAVREVPGGVLQVNGHLDLLEPGGAHYQPELAGYLRDAARAGRLELRVHDVLTDVQLWRYLASLDASVVPDRFRTHSGWLEACRDLGTTVIAPDSGYLVEQGPMLSYHQGEDLLDEASLVEAVRAAWRHRRLGEVTVVERRRQRVDVAARHELLYRAVLN